MSASPVRGVLGFGAAGEDLELCQAEASLGDTPVGQTRVWVPMQRELRVKWRALDPPRAGFTLERTSLAIEHPDLGTVRLPVEVTQSRGWGDSPGASLGEVDDIDRIVVHWVNLASIFPSEVLSDAGASWNGRWRVDSCGWRFTIDSRPDLDDALRLAKEADEQFLITHVGELRRVDGSSFDAAGASDVLFAWQLALSFALGRWVAPAVPVGFDRHGRRIWEQWAPWRCDSYWGYASWWDTHTGADLADFVGAFVDAYLDRSRHDATRLTAMHVVAANHAGTTSEGRVMLAQAGLEYTSWVNLVLSRRMSRRDYLAMTAAERLRLLLTEARIPIEVPDALPGLFDLASQKGYDGPAAAAWVRNRLVHPKDAGEPYRIDGLVWQTAQLLLEYGELLLLHSVGYGGRYMRRYPPHRWAHDSETVPWVAR